MSKPFITVEGKKAHMFSTNLYLKIGQKENPLRNEWLAVKNGKIIDREDFQIRDLDYIPELKRWAEETVERGKKNDRFGKKFRVRIGQAG